MTSQLSSAQVRKLKSLAQHLDPVLRVGKSGLSDSFLQSLDEALSHHELVKVKFAEFKEQKKELAPRLAESTSSHLIMRVGNVLVLHRPRPIQEAPEAGSRPEGSDHVC